MALTEAEELELLELEEEEAKSGGFAPPVVSGYPAFNKDATGSFGKFLATSKTLPIAGGVVGGIAGGIPLAGLMGAGGESYRQLLARKYTDNFPTTSTEAAKEIGIEGLTQSGGAVINKTLPIAGKVAMKIPGVKAVTGFAKKTMSDLFYILTKIEPKNATTLFKNPKAILPVEWTKAQIAWRKAAKEAGLPIDDVSPEIINAMKKDARSTVFETFEKIQRGEATVAEAQIAKEVTRIALKPAAKTERNRPLIVLYNKMEDVFRDVISKKSPDLAAANKQYAIAKAGKRFRSFFPRNLDDSPAYFRSSVLPTALGIAGQQRGEPIEGALQAGGIAALTSPMAIGTGIALAGGVRNLAPYARRPISAMIAERFRDE